MRNVAKSGTTQAHGHKWRGLPHPLRSRACSDHPRACFERHHSNNQPDAGRCRDSWLLPERAAHAVMQALSELDVHISNLSARCPARLHQRLDDGLFDSLSKGLVLGHQVPVWCVLPVDKTSGPSLSVFVLSACLSAWR